MSFSSAQWTIPELCVWIVTRSREAVNALPPKVKESLKYAEMAHPGAYAARDEIVEAAQADVIGISCAGQKNFHGTASPRRMLTSEFWKNAEIQDQGHWEAPGSFWCVAKRVDQPAGTSGFHELLVDSAQAKARWPASSDAVERLPGSGTSAEVPAAPTDTEIKDWMSRHQLELKKAGNRHGRDVVLSAAREKFKVQYKRVKELWASREP